MVRSTLKIRLKSHDDDLTKWLKLKDVGDSDASRLDTKGDMSQYDNS